MEDNNEQEVEHTEEVVEETVEEKVEEAVETVESEEKDDRPAENWKAEAERRKAENERLKRELASREVTPKAEVKRDPNDISTWSDAELKMLSKAKDASIPESLKDKADDLIVDRKIKRLREQEREEEKRTEAQIRLANDYPESQNPSSTFSLKMKQVMREYDLHRTPAGELAAAKIAAAELKTGTSVSTAKGRKSESDRVARVKGQMAEGDRPKPADDNPTSKKKIEEIEQGARAGNQKAFGDVLKLKGLTRESFFPSK